MAMIGKKLVALKIRSRGPLLELLDVLRQIVKALDLPGWVSRKVFLSTKPQAKAAQTGRPSRRSTEVHYCAYIP